MGSIERQVLELDDCEIDLAQCELIRGGERSHLTTKEVEVIAYLAQNPSRSVSYEELLERVWGHPRLASTQPVYSVIKRLRRKLDGHGEHRHLVTVHGVGYRFEPPSRPRSPSRPRPPSRPSVAPPPRASSLSSFVGRTEELERIEALLSSEAQLISLVGPGGAGKTRVALEVVQRLRAQGKELVMADLSNATSSEEVARSIASALGVPGDEEAPRKGAGTGDAFAAAARALHARPVFGLLLDNAEHVLDAVAQAVAELHDKTRIVITTRERLAVPGEHVVEVGPLPLARGTELFLARASAAGTSVADRPLIEAIVARLDGLPLAIEIAAAHAGVVSLARTKSDLDQQLDRLLTTRRGVPSRQATLRSSVAWSWSLLSPEEQRVLTQCVVFRGGFSHEAAEAVVEIGGPVRPWLVRASERSLVHALPERPGRFALYACVRELAAEHLADEGELADRHLRWARALCLRLGVLDEVPPKSAYAELSPELENLRAALEHALTSDIAAATDLALAIDWLLTPSHGPGEAEELARVEKRATGRDLVRVRLALGRSRLQRGAEGLRFLDETRALASAEGTPIEGLEAERLFAACQSLLGNPGAALGPLTSAVERGRALASGSAILGRLVLDLGETHLAGGRFEQAGELLLEAGRLLESVGDRSQAARAACSLSHVHRERGESEHALSSLEHARRLLEDAGDEVALARLSLDRGIVLAHLSRSLEASEVLDAAIAAHRRLGLVPGEIRARDWRVLALLGLGRDEEALLEAREIQQLALILDRPSYEAERAFGATWLVSGELAAADEAFGRALSILSLGGKEAVRGHVLSVRALARMLMGRLPEAEADLVACTQIHELRGSRAAQAISRAELTLVHALMNADEGEAAEAHLALAERGLGSPWEKRVARGRRAVLAIARARHAGASGAAIAALHRKARAELLEGAPAPSDYFTRCTLLLLDHVASG